jgi:hypothetical protein
MKKQKIKYDGFLTESKLQNIISQIEFVENLRFNEKDKYQQIWTKNFVFSLKFYEKTMTNFVRLCNFTKNSSLNKLHVKNEKILYFFN